MANPSTQSVFTQFCLDLQSATRGVPGIVSEQVIIGHIEFFRHQEFYKDVADGGYWAIIGLPSGDGEFLKFEGDFDVNLDLFYPVLADKSVDWSGVNNTIGNLIAGWAHWTAPGTQGPPNYLNGSEWAKGQNRSPLKFRWDKPYIRYDVKPYGDFLSAESFIASTQFQFTMPYMCDQAANPFLEPMP